MLKMPDKPVCAMNEDSIISSPITSLLASLNKRTRPRVRGKKRKASSRTTNAKRTTHNSVQVDTEYDCYDSLSTTNWVEVVFLQTGQVSVDPFHVQGGRKDTVGVTIIPEWRPSSPPESDGSVKGSGQVEVSSPKRLLPSSFIKTAHVDSLEDESDSCGSVSEMYIEPSPPADPKPIPKEEAPERSILSILLTAQSPLATANIKGLLSSERLYSLPPMTRNQILQLLPQCDKDYLLMDEQKAIDSALNNVYINAALREWQDHLALGSLYCSNRASPTNGSNSSSCPPSWKDHFYEENWGDRNGFVERDVPHLHKLPTESYSTNQQSVYDCLFSTNPTPPKPIVSSTGPPSSSPSLPVHLPRQHYNAVHTTRRQVLDEHSYSKPRPSNHSRLSLAFKSRCVCMNAPLRMCIICHRFFHSGCSLSNTCQCCVKRKEMDTLL